MSRKGRKAQPSTWIAERVDLGILGPALADDVSASIQRGIKDKIIFGAPSRPLALFRHSVAAAIRHAEADGKRFDLFCRFLRHGPRDDHMAEDLRALCLPDAETAATIRFIYHRIINRFQGELAELLAVGPIVRLLERLRLEGKVPSTTEAYLGDTVQARVGKGTRAALAADLHLIDRGNDQENPSLVGIAEIKSYEIATEKLFAQIERHIQRGRRGLVVQGRPVSLARGSNRVLRIGVAPSAWKLPRTFRFEGEGSGRLLHVDPPIPPAAEDRIEQVAERSWRITLRWSHEALASAAYDLTFWLMGEVGASVYAADPRPEWAGMTPEEMGRNAAQAMLHSAIFRARTDWEKRRVIALYNAYGFGYALGANFVDKDGRRDALWPEDLDELLAHGVTKHGGRLR